MKIDKLTLLVGGLVCGVAVGHSHHEKEGGEFDPLAAPEYVQESVEELERKWSFEVCLSISLFIIMSGFASAFLLGSFLS